MIALPAASSTRAGPVISLREVVHPTPRQDDYLAALRGHRYALYGGAAGGGKSYILRWALVGLLLRWAREGHQHVRVGLFCETFPALKDRHLSKVRYEFPHWLGRLHASEHEFRLAERWGGGVIAFRNLDDPAKYLSSEFAAIAVDELSRNPQATFDFLRMRLRWPGIDAPRFLAATNPGGIGHTFVKQLWIERDFPPELAPLADEFAFVQARAADNPYLPASYAENLASLPGPLRRAYLEGDWDVFEGQVFGEFRRELHVCTPFEIPADWTRVRCVDWGYAAPFCCLWLAQSPVAREVVVYREVYATGLRDEEQAALIAKSTAKGEVIRRTVGDPSMWAKRMDAGVSAAEVYRRGGVPMVPASNERVAGWARLHEFLAVDAGAKRPRLRIFSTCANLIRTLPALVYDTTNVEDVDTEGEDHAPDALRYGLMSLARPLRSQTPRPLVFGDGSPTVTVPAGVADSPRAWMAQHGHLSAEVAERSER